MYGTTVKIISKRVKVTGDKGYSTCKRVEEREIGLTGILMFVQLFLLQVNFTSYI